MDDKTNEVIVREFLNTCYRSDGGKRANPFSSVQVRDMPST
jgi:hypothetical protein